ncbi:MAG: cupin domain-containing protein [Acutalibacter sp.]|jgi:mannose-6-phosphate isomerase-like protein (cupin superfamily)|nr:cupin domain-containing protein [Acutalibacter sp.]
MTIRNFLDMEMHSEAIHGGKGLCSHGTVFDGAEIQGPVSFINHTILPPGASFGLHKHGRDNEFYILLRGEGVYHQEGEQAQVKQGDIIMNAPFAAHGIENTGSEELELLVFEVTL